MTGFSKLLRKTIHRVGNTIRAVNIAWLRLTGAEIGENCMISLRAKIDVRRGKVIIGDNSTVTYGCVILSHDATARRINP
ncbi:hypothetical protein BuS5_01235 [Desulfosarcina sp. BuS5]|uniref:hypothetical protein n=1 Tax=Desulfosarcina sp. BuS5 TaxID=933262 RepID=UPI000551BE50|nr:hypothetical protein [Desulfosarcina sp. BuS5]WDN88267.1 hypothetical protein BuS5_01235 [Desulfosarcina sp. BuS5]